MSSNNELQSTVNAYMMAYHNERAKLSEAQAIIQKLQEENAAKDKRITQLEEAVIASESAFLTQVVCDYNDVIHAAYMKCKEAIKKEVTK